MLIEEVEADMRMRNIYHREGVTKLILLTKLPLLLLTNHAGETAAIIGQETQSSNREVKEVEDKV
jgi:hypothetical protein